MTNLVNVSLALILLIILTCGIIYVPAHDGQLVDLGLLVLLPTLGLCWCIANLIPKHKQD